LSVVVVSRIYMCRTRLFVSCGVVFWSFNGDRHAQICVLSVCTVTHTFPVFFFRNMPFIRAMHRKRGFDLLLGCRFDSFQWSEENVMTFTVEYMF
jgi:hypothetical protein